MKPTPRFAHLVLKPTLACTARCETCSTRKRLHGIKKKEPQLGITDWKRLFAEVDSLGLSKLTISGGEPTLYKDLLELIAEGKAKASDFPDFEKESGFRPPQTEFIDEVTFDGTKPNDYLKKFNIGLKGEDVVK